MRMVHIAPSLWAAVGLLGLAVVSVAVPLSDAGWIAGAGALVAGAALVTRGLVRRGAATFGWANTATAARAALAGIITALVATAVTQPVPGLLVAGLAAPALALDAVDGWLARRTGGESELGARFDMEVDAFLMLVLSVFVAPALGWWTLSIGLMRYAFVVVGWMVPWMRVTLPPRHWRKTVTAVNGIALAAAASGLLPVPLAAGAVAVALALLVESFGRDVVWLVARRVTGIDRPLPSWRPAGVERAPLRTRAPIPSRLEE
jgi:phosphatidylglycerophosphate synthase